jgi:6-phosphogluconolactonase
MDERTGALSGKGVVAECASPSFLAISPDGRFVFAVNETGDFAGAQTGSVTAFVRDPKTVALKPVNTVSSHGSYPCNITLAKSGKWVLVANYGSGTVAVLPVGRNGALGDASCVIQHAGSSADKARQEGPHAHSINLDRDNRFALACDLGTDEIITYRFDDNAGSLTRVSAVKAAPGAGPRHLAFHPNGRWVYAINELNSTIAAYRYDRSQGTLTPIETVPTLPEDFTGQSTTAEVVVHPSGKWVYGSNRGHDSIAAFAVNPASGALRPLGRTPTGGKTPRNFVLDPAGRFMAVANQDSNRLMVFTIDAQSGALAPTEHAADVPLPVCVRFVPRS